MNPSDESLQVVNTWLADNNIDATTISRGGDWLAISLPVSQANEMLDADFSVYTHEDSGTQIIRALQYSIPEDLVGHLQVVHPVTTFAVLSPKTASTSAGRVSVLAKQKRQSACDGQYIDPACLQELYGIPTAAATNPEPLLVTGYIEQYPSESDTEVRGRSKPSIQACIAHGAIILIRISCLHTALITLLLLPTLTLRYMTADMTQATQVLKQYVHCIILLVAAPKHYTIPEPRRTVYSRPRYRHPRELYFRWRQREQ